MTNEIAKEQRCLLLREGIEIWIDKEKAEKISQDLSSNRAGKFNKIEGRLINIADIVGIFNPKDLEELKRRKQGQWLCKYGYWHLKTELHCDCSVRNKKDPFQEKYSRYTRPQKEELEILIK